MVFEFHPIKVIGTARVKLRKHQITKTWPTLNAIDNLALSALERFLLGIKPEKLQIVETTYQSPIQTNYEENNTGRVRHYKASSGNAVIVLPQSGYGLDFGKIIASFLAANGINAYEVETPLYGSRLPAGVRSMYQVATHPDSLKLAFYQAVAEVRGVIDLIEEQKIGICGVSLGAIYASILYGIDERLSSGCLVMGGGNIADVIFDSKEKYVAGLRAKLEKQGMTREALRKELGEIEPLIYTSHSRSRDLLMINGAKDKELPRGNAMALANAWGSPEVLLVNKGHKNIIFEAPYILSEMLNHFRKTLD